MLRALFALALIAALIWFAPQVWAGFEREVARLFSWMVP